MNHPLLSVAGVVLAILSASCASFAQAGPFLQPRQAGIVRTDLLREASGLVTSRKNRGVLWAHNDSGDSARLFALNAKADLLGVCEIAGAQCRDWEDIAIGPGPDPNRDYLYIGDIGDNRAQYASVKVYRIPEPMVAAGKAFGQTTSAPAETIELLYPDGPRDAETLLLDPLTRDLYIISKRDLLSKVYRAAFPQSTTQRTTLERVTSLPWGFAVAGDVAPDGRSVIVRGMFNASLWPRTVGTPLWHAFSGKQVSLPRPNERQGEAICFDAEGAGYFTIGEMLHPPLHYVGRAAPSLDK